jgi:hypothetical protein
MKYPEDIEGCVFGDSNLKVDRMKEASIDGSQTSPSMRRAS